MSYNKSLMIGLCVLVVFWVGLAYLVYPAFAAPGANVGENVIPLSRDKATAPYAVFQVWGSGSNRQKCFDDADDTIKLSATYANCAVRFAQDAVTKVWFLTIPTTLPSGSYLVIIRDGADNSEANTDTDVAAPVITWNKDTQSLLVNQNDVFVSY
jgi:hypothetical protein